MEKGLMEKEDPKNFALDVKIPDVKKQIEDNNPYTAARRAATKAAEMNNK